MRSIQSAWIFNLALRLAAIVCLGVLAVGLVLDVEPLTALTRGVAAFIVFLVLGWGISIIWDVALPPADDTDPNRTAVSQAGPDETETQGATATAPEESPARA